MQHLQRIYLLLIAVLLHTNPGCAPQTGNRTKPSNRNAQSTNLNKSSQGEETASVWQLSEEVKNSSTRLKNLTSRVQMSEYTAKELCTKKQEIDKKCPLNVAISSGSKVESLNCTGQTEQITQPARLMVKITSTGGLSGKYILKINSYVSTPISLGVEQELTLTSLGSNELAPTFLKADKLSLEATSGNQNGSGELKIWNSDHPTIYASNLNFQNNSTVQLAYSERSRIVRSDLCSLNQNSYLTFLTQIQENYQKSNPSIEPSSSETEPELPTKPSELQAIFKDLEAQIATTQQKVDHSTDILSKLRAELIKGEGYGCWLSQPIKGLQIDIEGNFAGTKTVVERSRKKLESAGSAQLLRLDFGAFNVSTEASGRVVISEDYSNLSIGQITGLKMQKMGHEFNNTHIPCTKSTLGQLDNNLFNSQGNTCYIIKEQRQMQIRKISVAVYEGIKIFQQSFNPPILLKATNKKAPYLDLRSSPDWIKLLDRNDCELAE